MLHILGYLGEHIRSNHQMNALIHPVNNSEVPILAKDCADLVARDS